MRPSFLLLENAFLHLFIHFVEDARVVCGVQRTTCRKLFPSSTVWFSGISLKAPNGHPLPAKLSLAGPEVTSFLVFCCCALRCYVLCLRLIFSTVAMSLLSRCTNENDVSAFEKGSFWNHESQNQQSMEDNFITATHFSIELIQLHSQWEDHCALSVLCRREALPGLSQKC